MELAKKGFIGPGSVRVGSSIALNFILPNGECYYCLLSVCSCEFTYMIIVLS